MNGDPLVNMEWMAMMQPLVLDVAVEVERLITDLNSKQFRYRRFVNVYLC